MTWQEKFVAIKSLCGNYAPCLRMRAPNNWYVADLRVEIKKGSILHGVLGDGTTSEEAVEDCWEKLMKASSNHEPLVINAYTDNRKEYKWSGYMWTEI